MPPSPRPPATSRQPNPSPSVSVVISVLDPAGLPVMLLGLPVVSEVIVVTEGPEAATAAAVRTARPDALVIRSGRSGAGNALATGLAASNGDVVVTLNGDGSTDPREIPRYVAALTAGADVALGSRYREGGLDLTGSRLQTWVDRLLIWLINIVFGTSRTDPGFGYAAFRRDALERLDLPDPSARHAAAWGDGPEIGPLLALRPEARGLRVTEVGSIAYPRTNPQGRSKRAGVRDWIKAMTQEYAQQSGRHTADAASSEALLAPLRAQRHEIAVAAGLTRPTWPDADRWPAEPDWTAAPSRPSLVPAPIADGENNLPHLSARSGANAKPHGWPTGHVPKAGSLDTKSRSVGEHRLDATTARQAPPQIGREIGNHRRRLEQRPELRVINGTGPGHRNPLGQLRPVPRPKPAEG